jgi:CHAD domain-containing protein
MKGNLPAQAATEAWAREVRRQFRIIRKLERATAAGQSDALHDLREAIRRLRVLLRAMKKPLARTTAQTLARRWHHFLRSLNPARDAEVWRVLLSELPGVTPLFQQRVLKRLDQERGNLVNLLEHHTLYCLKRDTRALLKTEIPTALTPATKPDRALRKAWEQATRATKLAQRRPVAQPAVAHKVRIACRRARYLAEFFSVAAGGQQACHAWLKIAKRYQAAQNALGQTHDIDTLLEFLEAQQLRPTNELRATLVQRRTHGLIRFREAWRDVGI